MNSLKKYNSDVIKKHHDVKLIFPFLQDLELNGIQVTLKDAEQLNNLNFTYADVFVFAIVWQMFFSAKSDNV